MKPKRLRLNARGQLTLPHEVRQRERWHVGDEFELVKNADAWLLKPVRASVKKTAQTSASASRSTQDITPAPPPVALHQTQAMPVLRENLPLVMVVDDSAVVRKVAQRLLEREGYVVSTATDGVDALSQLQDMTPHVMLVDVEMPRMDGFELTRKLRANKHLARIPVIIISSHTDDERKAVAASLGVNVYLGKPYAEPELLALVKHYLAQSMNN